MRVGIKQSAASATVFIGVLLALVSVDARVRDRFEDLVAGGNGLSPWSARFADLSDALIGAARHQSIENAPLVIFAAVSAVLVLFMWRT
jgi:hypothetical protein